MLKVEIDAGEIDGAIAAFEGAPAKLRANMLAAMRSSLARVLKEAFDRVHVISGTLRRSITAAPPEANALGGYDGRVGTKLAYARIEELGFQGSENVRQYARRARGRDVKESRKIVAVGLGYVRAHKRNINRQPHPYLRPALEASRSAIVGYHVTAVQKTIDEMKVGGS